MKQIFIESIQGLYQFRLIQPNVKHMSHKYYVVTTFTISDDFIAAEKIVSK